MPGVASTMVNFTVRDYLQRTSRLNTLQSIKIDLELGETEAVLHFSKHGKLANLNQNKHLNDLIELEDVEKIIAESFRSAYELIALVGVRKFLEKNGYGTIDGLSEFTSKRLKIVQSTVKNMQPHPDQSSKDQINQEDMMIVDDAEDEDEYVDGNDTDYRYESDEAGEEDDNYIDTQVEQNGSVYGP